MNQPTWPPAPYQPPARRRRGPAVVVFALLGALVGMVAPSFLFAVLTGQPNPFGIIGMLAGMWLGLAGGIWFGVRTTRR
jgi:hypothetical protein